MLRAARSAPTQAIAELKRSAKMKQHSAKEWKTVIRLYDVIIVFLILLMLVIVTNSYIETGQVRAPASVASLLWFVIWIFLRGIARKKKEAAEAMETKAALDISSK